jgi:putative peptide zinc metalloprotease protein
LNVTQQPTANREARPGLWGSLEQAVEEMPAPAANLWATLEDRLDFSKGKPKRAPGVEVARHRTTQGAEYYVLHQLQARTYLKIEPQDHFLWELMDGEHSIRDLALAYFIQYKAFPFDRLVYLIGQLKARQLLTDKPHAVFGAVADHFASQTLAYRLQRFADASMQKEFSLDHAERFFNGLYRYLAWPLFTRPALVLEAIVALVGLVLFGRLLFAGAYPLASTAGSFGLGLMVLFLSQYITALFHECGHALTCTSYGRQVRKGGLLFYYGSPAWFVDTTDIWMAPKSARILVSLAGPSADMVFSGLLTVVVALLPSWGLSSVLFQIAAVGYLGVLLNLTPFLELDGYFVLMDWLEIPLLRKKSFAFLRERMLGPLLSRVRAKRAPSAAAPKAAAMVSKAATESPAPQTAREATAARWSRQERIMAIYGLLAAAWTGLSVLLTIYLWQSQLRVLIQTVLGGGDILAAVLLGGLALISAVPLILGLAVRLVLLADKALAARRKAG